MILLDGKTTAATIRAEIKDVISRAVAGGQRAPGLAVIIVGDDPASQIYVRNKANACREVGINSSVHRLPASSSQNELLALIDSLNKESAVDGILLQLPLSKGLDTTASLLAIAPDKDVDGFHPENVGRLSLGLPGFAACTPLGIMELLKRFGLSPKGKKAVVVGRSDIVGKPLAMMLVKPFESANATVTVCHSATANLMAECRSADYLFAAMGKPRAITANMVREGAVVVDVGINRTAEGLCGDVDFAGVKDKVHAITPVPGGVGPMTIAMLLKNTLQAWENHTAF